jgi:hypothetical protein
MQRNSGSTASGINLDIALAVECTSGAPVAQMDRASAFGAEGWEFESLRAHHPSLVETSNAANKPSMCSLLKSLLHIASYLFFLDEVSVTLP